MFGKLSIIGRLGADPEMKYTPAGQAVTELSIAVDQGYGDKKTTLWVRAKAWGKQDGTGGMAESAANFLHKGSLVFVEGRPSVRAYIANDGTARASLEVSCDELKFLSPKPEGEGTAPQPRAATAQAAARPAVVPPTGQFISVSPDGKFGWNGTAWVPIPPPGPPAPPPPAAAPIPPPPAPPAPAPLVPDAALDEWARQHAPDPPVHDVDPDDIPF